MMMTTPVPEQDPQSGTVIEPIRLQARRQLDAYLLRFPAEAQRLAALRAQLDDDGEGAGDPFWRGNMRGHITTSAFVLDAGLSRMLMIEHRVIGRWLQPGGHYEAGAGSAASPASLWDSALREVAEETGLGGPGLIGELSPHPAWGSALPLDIDSHAIAANPAKGEGAHWHHDYAYLMIAPADAGPLRPQLAEVHGAAWRPLAELAGSAEPRFRGLLAKLARLG